jgi:hypothetical protein
MGRNLNQHIECGWKPTSIFDSLGRFEIVKQPAGAYGCKVTWIVWDHKHDGRSRSAIAPFKTLKTAKAGLEDWTNKVVSSEVEYDFRVSQGQRLKHFPDGSSAWFDSEDNPVPYGDWSCAGPGA